MGESVTDGDYDALVRTAEERIPCEIRCHFPGMTSCRLLRNGGGASPACVSRVRKRLRTLVREADARVESCESRVLSCTACQVLKGYCVMWVESFVSVIISDSFAASSEGRRRANGCVARKECERHDITLLSLHIIDLTASQHPEKHSFALQSVSQPGRVLHPECYPYHMVHFGLLMYVLWQSPDEVFREVRAMQAWKGKSTPSSRGLSTLTSLSLPPSLLTRPEDTLVLILGLGGNVIGNCLDAVLSVDVPIDIVEVEPAVLDTCRRHGQIPPCSEAQGQKTGQTARVWVVSRGQQRHPHYRFIIGDARELLRAGNEGKDGSDVLYSRGYSMIFLDCYDPEAERMMHDGGLVDLCRSRLRPGGALIVNAHILPSQETLEEQFLSRGFASVQALRVAGCDQSIVVCLAGSVAPASRKSNGADEQQLQQDEQQTREKQDRFCVRHAWQMARYMCDDLGTDPDARRLFRPGFCLDAGWLKASRALNGASCPARVWEHYD